MKKHVLLSFAFACEVFCLPFPAHASDDRIALLLTGDACALSHGALKQKLSRVAGVRQIDLHAVPNHALIDADTAVVDADSLASQVNDILAAQPPCRATPLKSCISSDLRTASTKTP